MPDWLAQNVSLLTFLFDNTEKTLKIYHCHSLFVNVLCC
jgi:hypothetical protein